MTRLLIMLLLFCAVASAQEWTGYDPHRGWPASGFWSKKIIVLITATSLVTATDIETTVYCTRHVACVEANGLYPRHPGRPMMYGAHFSATGAAVGIAYLLHRHHYGPLSDVAIAPFTAVESYATVHNLREIKKEK